MDVYNTSKQQGEAKITNHMVLFEPANGQMTVNETYILVNASKTAWNDSDQGTLKFFLPAGAGGKAQVQATAPGGMPIGAGVLKTGKPDIFGVDFPVKPGETRIDVTYATPYTAGQPFAGKVPSKDENTYLIAPNGITLEGKGLNDLGTEPRTQAHIYGLTGSSYEIALSGAVAARPGGDASGGDQGVSSGRGSNRSCRGCIRRRNRSWGSCLEFWRWGSHCCTGRARAGPEAYPTNDRRRR